LTFENSTQLGEVLDIQTSLRVSSKILTSNSSKTGRRLQMKELFYSFNEILNFIEKQSTPSREESLLFLRLLLNTQKINERDLGHGLTEEEELFIRKRLLSLGFSSASNSGR
jgi:hypothetical protein